MTSYLPNPYVPQLPRRSRPTCHKFRYADKRAALTALNARTTGHQRNRPSFLRAYPCPDCGGWHLTSKE